MINKKCNSNFIPIFSYSFIFSKLEKKKFRYEEINKYKYNHPGYQKGTGHFTQIIWRETKQVGVAFARSADGRRIYIVARYYPPGNFVQTISANVAPVKT